MSWPHAIWVLRRAPRRGAVVLTAVGLSLIAAARPSGQTPTLASVLEVATLYVEQFKQDLSAVVAEEHYRQDVRARGTGAAATLTMASDTRQLRSDLLLVNMGRGRYVQFRDVYEVDGEAVRDRDQRLTGLFLDPSPSAAAQRERILEASARYNIGNVRRTLNVPTMPLMFLEAEFQPRFRFSRSEDPRKPSLLGIEADPLPSRLWVIDYRETARQTIVRRADGRSDQPAQGRFWIDPGSGRVVMTEMSIDGPSVKTVINVRYEPDPKTGLYVPTLMKERYDVSRDRTVVEGNAAYTNFRKFTVETEENLRTAK